MRKVQFFSQSVDNTTTKKYHAFIRNDAVPVYIPVCPDVAPYQGLPTADLWKYLSPTKQKILVERH